MFSGKVFFTFLGVKIGTKIGILNVWTVLNLVPHPCIKFNSTQQRHLLLNSGMTNCNKYHCIVFQQQ